MGGFIMIGSPRSGSFFKVGYRPLHANRSAPLADPSTAFTIAAIKAVIEDQMIFYSVSKHFSTLYRVWPRWQLDEAQLG